MKTTTIKYAGLVLLGMLLGCGVAAVAPARSSWAQPRSGGWGCYVVDRFPDPRVAADWESARYIKEGLDQVAPTTAAGTILTITPKSGGYADVLCVKH